jgi:feruloyl-CoA synthase
MNELAYKGAAWRGAHMRNVRCWSPSIEAHDAPDGTIYINQLDVLPPYQQSIANVLHYWASHAPDRTAFAAKNKVSGWDTLTYSGCLSKVRKLAQYLLNCRLSKHAPIAILSGNDLEHVLLSLAAAYVGIAYVPISPAYSTLDPSFVRLHSALAALSPELIFAATAEKFRPAILQCAPNCRQLYTKGASSEDEDFYTALQTEPTEDVDNARARVSDDTIVKYIFTSGSTGQPKAVINTNGMICSNQAMVREVFSFLKDEPPVLLDWAPWHHTGGGNKVFYMSLFNGGSFFIDDGRPIADEIEKTVRNIIDVAPTWYFNVPAGFDALIPHLKSNPVLRKGFFQNLKMIWYAGASLKKETWEELEGLSVQETGERVLIATGLGSTETAPVALMCTWPQDAPGNVGLPCPGISLKLVPVGDKYEARIKGPNVTPGYHDATPKSQPIFDDEQYYKSGDLLSLSNPNSISAGFKFEGRLEENFKLDTGTWVNVGELRLRFLDHFGSMVKDVAIVGADRPYLGALVFPDLDRLVKLSRSNDRNPIYDEDVINHFYMSLKSFANLSSSSSTRIGKIVLMEEPLSSGDGEITDKGSINHLAVLARRGHFVSKIYNQWEDDFVIRLDTHNGK